MSTHAANPAWIASLSQLRELIQQPGRLPSWRVLQRLFNRRVQRERALMILVGLVATLMLADSLWLGQAWKTYAAARNQRDAARATLSGLQAESQKQRESQQAQAQQLAAELTQWRQRVKDGDEALRRHEETLVGPDRMVELLGALLTRHGEVRVRSLKSLGKVDLLAAPGTNSGAPTAGAPGDARPASLYRHGVELALEGGFADLLGYLQAMESLPQHVLWGAVSLRVEQHPRSVLTLRVYTISRDRHWLEI
jgi:MSHA biogenesis protein MshJ